MDTKSHIALLVISSLFGTGGVFWLYLRVHHDPRDVSSRAGGDDYVRHLRELVELAVEAEEPNPLDWATARNAEMWNRSTSAQEGADATEDMPWWQKRWKWKRNRGGDSDPPALP